MLCKRSLPPAQQGECTAASENAKDAGQTAKGTRTHSKQSKTLKKKNRWKHAVQLDYAFKAKFTNFVAVEQLFRCSEPGM